MTIDMFVHPGFIDVICNDPERVAFRRKYFGLYKQHVWPLELVFLQMDAAGIDKAVLMPEDLATQANGSIVTNEEIAELVKVAPSRFIGFASVDPNSPDCADKLIHAVDVLSLSGLHLNPSTQQFYPDDDKLAPLYEICVKRNIPIVMDIGMSLEPSAPSKFAQPLHMEDVLLQYPKLRICAAHFGFPWVTETATLMLRYPNLYADTGLLYFDSPKEFFAQIFGSQLGMHWIDRSLNNQVMFASNYPRIEQLRMVEAVRSMKLRDITLHKIMGKNAEIFLKGETN